LKYAEHIIDVDKKDTFRIYPVGDLHKNLKTFKEKDFKKYIKHIKDDPNGVAIFMGDMSDARDKMHKFFAANMIDSRFHIEDIDNMEFILAKELAEDIAPIAHKTLGLITGNHHAGYFTQYLLERIETLSKIAVPNLGNRGMIRLKGKRKDNQANAWTYIVFATHRDSTGKKPGSQYNNQMDVQGSFQADLYLYSHSHRPSQQALPIAYMPVRGKLGVLTRRVQHINAGSFVESISQYDNYADDKNLPPQLNIHYYAEAKYDMNTGEMNTKAIEWEP
jgi:hypothetical protein